MAHDIFISHSSKDKTTADAICAVLEGESIRCWIAPRDVLPGCSYAEALNEALLKCRVLILILSSNSNASGHVMREVESALGVGIPVLPFRIEDVQPTKALAYYLKSIHWLDAMTPPLEKHLLSLAATIKVLLSQQDPVHRSNNQKTALPSDEFSTSAATPKGKNEYLSQTLARPTWLKATSILLLCILLTLGVGYYVRSLPEKDNDSSRNKLANPPEVTNKPEIPKPPTKLVLRERIEQLAQHSRTVRKIMHEGSPLIFGADKVAEEYKRSLGDQPSPESFRKDLGPDNAGPLLPIAIAGWKATPGAEELERHISDMKTISKELKGGFLILDDCVELLSRIADDSYSYKIYYNILTIDPNIFFKDLDPSMDVRDLGKALTSSLRGNSAAYFLTRYDEATKNIDQIIVTIANNIQELPDEDITAIESIDVIDLVKTSSTTDHMRFLYRDVGPKMSIETRQSIVNMIDQLHISISKEKASERLDNLKLKK
ncbi:MAG: toll/interleukin-1 receptor domain-containing protein [Planctomycetota bacterium]